MRYRDFTPGEEPTERHILVVVTEGELHPVMLYAHNTAVSDAFYLTTAEAAAVRDQLNAELPAPSTVRYLDIISEALGDNAFRFTCEEMDAICALYVAAGRAETAVELLSIHAADDERDDAHHGMDIGACAAHINRLTA